MLKVMDLHTLSARNSFSKSIPMSGMTDFAKAAHSDEILIAFCVRVCVIPFIQTNTLSANEAGELLMFWFRRPSAVHKTFIVSS